MAFLSLIVGILTYNGICFSLLLLTSLCFMEKVEVLGKNWRQQQTAQRTLAVLEFC